MIKKSIVNNREENHVRSKRAEIKLNKEVNFDEIRVLLSFLPPPRRPFYNAKFPSSFFYSGTLRISSIIPVNSGFYFCRERNKQWQRRRKPPNSIKWRFSWQCIKQNWPRFEISRRMSSIHFCRFGLFSQLGEEEEEEEERQQLATSNQP